MAQANLKSLLGEEHAALTIDNVSYAVVSVLGREAVSTLFQFDVACRLPDDGAANALVGKVAVLTLADGYGAERRVTALVCTAESLRDDVADARLPGDTHHGELRLELRPAAFRLTLGSDCRVFHDLAVPGIVADVCARAGIEARFELVGSYATRPYTAQYRESDWHFVCRLCEEEGIHYWFDHEEGESRVVFADLSSAAPELFGGASVPYVQGTGMQKPAEHVSELGPVTSFAPSRFTVRSFDPARPKLALAASNGSGPFEIYDAPGAGPTAPDVVAARARVRAEAAASERHMASGSALSVRVVPGRVLEISGHEVGRLDGRYFVTSATLEVTQRRRGEAHGPSRIGAGKAPARPLACRFEALEERVPYRPPARTPVTKQAGLQSGVVAGAPGSEVHPDAEGRVRVQLHWDRLGTRDHESGHWLRVAQRGTADSMLLPRVGWHVYSVNEEGTLDLPIVLSRFYDAEHPPPYALPDNMTQTLYKTATTPGGGSHNEIRFEDRAGKEEMFINSTKDMNVLVQDRKTETVARHVTKKVAVDRSLDVGQNSAHVVSGNYSLTVGGNESETVGSGRDKTVNGDETTKIGGSRKVETGEALTTNVTGARKLSVGVAQIDVSLGDISLTAPFVNVLVGGAMIKMTLKNLKESVGSKVSATSLAGQIGGKVAAVAGLPGVAGALAGLPSVAVGGVAQTIGGAKFEFGVKGRELKVDKGYVETVGGMMMLKTTASFHDEADTTWAGTVTGFVQGHGDSIVIEAEEEITLSCGGTVIKLKKGEGISVESAAVSLPDAKLLEATASAKVLANS